MSRRTYRPSYTESGDKIIYCRGLTEDTVSVVLTAGICFYPIAFSDGEVFVRLHDGEAKYFRRGKASCSKCGYVTTLTPKML